MTAATSAIRVLIADDHAIVREGIRQVLCSDEKGAIDVVGEASTGAQAVALAIELRPDVVVLDITMPELSGLEAAARIRDDVPDAAILVLSIHDHEEYVMQSMRAGAQGYLRKDSSPAELRGAVRALYGGGSYFSTPVVRSVAASARGTPGEEEGRAKLAALTPREREILVEISCGWTNKEIAAHLGISVRTVESHRDALMRKLGIRGAAALTRFAVDAGIA
jgi:DNA-binding NarL/FixJ family response regulator